MHDVLRRKEMEGAYDRRNGGNFVWYVKEEIGIRLLM